MASLLNPFALRRCVLHTRMTPSECDMRLRYRAHVAGIESRPTKTGFAMRKRAWHSHWSDPKVVGRFAADPGGTRIDIALRYTGLSLVSQLYWELLWLLIPLMLVVAAITDLTSGGRLETVLLSIVASATFVTVVLGMRWIDTLPYGAIIQFLKTNLEADDHTRRDE